MISVIQKRKSIRKYKDTPLTQDELNTIREAIQLSPTWKNKQCFEVIEVVDKALIAQIGDMVRHNPGPTVYSTVPVVYIFVADPTKSGNRDEKPYYMADTAIAITHATLTATSLGLGSCWIGVFPEETLKEALNIPSHLRIVGLLPVGHPDEDPDARPRRSVEEIFHTNKY